MLNIQGDTQYESIGCVGYNPQLEQLRATINIKQTGGYDGGLCDGAVFGGVDVRFYLSDARRGDLATRMPGNPGCERSSDVPWGH